MWQTIGQPKIVSLLQKALTLGNLSHAYLLVGPPQIGKMTLALDVAKALNCTTEKGEKPCGECTACQKIAAGKHADVQIVGLNQDPDSEDARTRTEISIEQVRDMLHTSSFPAFEGKYRVYIIDEASHLSLDAANRLLKTLEEPAGNVVFILLTENVQLVPATIVSRCQRLNLSRMKTKDIESVLINRWQAESLKARLLARLSHGCLGWAIKALEDAHLLEQRRERFDKMLVILKSGYSERFNLAAQLSLQFTKKRETVYEILDEWLGWWRDALLVKTGCAADVVNIDFSAALDEMAGAYSLAQIKTALQDIREAEEQLKLNVNARLALEALMLNLPLMTARKAAIPQVEVKNA